MWNRRGSLWRATHKRPRPLSHLRCQLSQRESLWRNRRLCNLPDNFLSMPRAPSQRGLSAQQTGGVSVDTPSVSLCSTAPPRGRLCAMPETLSPPLKAVPLGKVASPQAMTEGATSAQAHFALQPETFPPCQGLSLWESWRVAPERARMLKLNSTLGEFSSRFFHFFTPKS